jgi:hypothetical protein
MWVEWSSVCSDRCEGVADDEWRTEEYRGWNVGVATLDARMVFIQEPSAESLKDTDQLRHET